jgi:hypothetical protein
MKSRKIRLLDGQKHKLKVFTIVDPKQIALWQGLNGSLASVPPLPMFISLVEKPVPERLLRAFYNELTADDAMLLRSIPHSLEGMVEKDILVLTNAILDVFAHAGKVNQLIVALASVDFGAESVDATNICRENSTLTNLFKVFYQRYGRPYYENVILPIINQIDEAGDLGLAVPKEEDAERIGELVFGTLNKITDGVAHITPQIHHLASILKMFSAVRFNSRRTTYNSLSLFFFTRFVTATFANPVSYDAGFASKTDSRAFLAKVTIPFSQMMQSPFNLLPMAKKYEPFQSLNGQLNDIFFPKLYEFLMRVADPPAEPPEYEKPDEARLGVALNYLLEKTWRAYDQVVGKYTERLASAGGNAPISWSVGSFFMRGFNEAGAE